MIQVKRQALVSYSARQMYELVLDVPSYPEFLPWCTHAEVLEQTLHSQLARLHIARGGMKQSFTTRNSLIPGEMVRLELVEGPFRSLAGNWQFQRLDEQDTACKVLLDLAFVPTSALAGIALGSFFAQSVNTMVDSFCKRARDVYASSPSAAEVRKV